MHKVGLDYIEEQLRELNKCASINPDKEFLVTLIGCGIAGFEVEDIEDICESITWGKNVIIPDEFVSFEGFKAFNADMTCRDFKYNIGETYEQGDAKLCNHGFHFCKFPLDIFEYHPLIDNDTPLCVKSAQIDGREP
ncbi:MAG: hypothetical protein R3Y49_02970 [Rikenellaceae bacterium]